MEQLIKIGQISPKNSSEIGYSKISLGFEKLDRNVFDPNKAYDAVAACGVKRVRIQSGWERTERERGVYDFAWIDSIVENFLLRGIEPWVCLCYGNPLYTETAKNVFGSVGCPPIFSEDERTAWTNYVKAFVSRYRGKIHYYEVWNEPDGDWCWKHGPSGTELGLFTVATAKAVKQADPDAKVIGGVVCLRKLSFLNEAFSVGMGESIDFISYHEYTHDERHVIERVNAFRALAKEYNPAIELIQGESGSQSRSGGHGACHTGAWTQKIQAKQLSRHMLIDLLSGVHFTSYFSCVDMIEALNGTTGDKASYLDYGYFGILSAEFDENGKSTGEYSPKLSYYALQNICSVFAETPELCTLPVYVHSNYSGRRYDTQPEGFEITRGGFRRETGDAFVYWYPSNIMTTDYLSSITLEYYSRYKDLKLIDVIDGSIYEIPSHMIEDKGNGCFEISELPIKDTPLILTFGDFLI